MNAIVVLLCTTKLPHKNCKNYDRESLRRQELYTEDIGKNNYRLRHKLWFVVVSVHEPGSLQTRWWILGLDYWCACGSDEILARDDDARDEEDNDLRENL